MVTPKQKNWSSVFLVKNIKQFVKNKSKCGIHSFEFIAREETPKWQQRIKYSPGKLNTKYRPVSRYTEERPSRICSTPGAGERHYKRVKELCLETRKNVQLLARDFSLKSNVLRTACKNCDDAVKTATENWLNEGISPELIMFKNKLKEKRRKSRSPNLFN